MGSRIKPGNLKNAIIDKVVRVSDYECITNCQFLLNLGLFVGASSGATLAAIRKTIHNWIIPSTSLDFKNSITLSIT